MLRGTPESSISLPAGNRAGAIAVAKACRPAPSQLLHSSQTGHVVPVGSDHVGLTHIVRGTPYSDLMAHGAIEADPISHFSCSEDQQPDDQAGG